MESIAASQSLSSVSYQPFGFETSIPSKFKFIHDPSALSSDSIPVIDFSALTAGDPDQRSKAIQDLSKACQEWGFFILVNHGIPDALMNSILTACREFFYLSDAEKKQYKPKSDLGPITCGNFNISHTSNLTFTLWRDYLMLYMHPEFHCPLKPPLLRGVLLEYSERIRKLARKVLEAVTENLELEQHYVDEVLKLDSSFQLFAANFYPPCPQPDQAIGIPSHSDYGLFTFLIHNGVVGLQIEKDGQWFNINSPQDSILVNVSDQLEIFTNGRCKSVKHRAVLNNQTERISIVLTNGPSREAVVGPAAPLVQKDGCALYRPMKFGECIEALYAKSGRLAEDCSGRLNRQLDKHVSSPTLIIYIYIYIYIYLSLYNEVL